MIMYQLTQTVANPKLETDSIFINSENLSYMFKPQSRKSKQGVTNLSLPFVQIHTAINSTNFKSFLTKIVIHYVQNFSPLRENQNLFTKPAGDEHVAKIN